PDDAGAVRGDRLRRAARDDAVARGGDGPRLRARERAGEPEVVRGELQEERAGVARELRAGLGVARRRDPQRSFSARAEEEDREEGDDREWTGGRGGRAPPTAGGPRGGGPPVREHSGASS